MLDKIPVHVLEEAIAHCVAKYKTCIANFVAKRQKHCYISNWDFKKQRELLIFEAQLFSKKKNAIAVRALGEMKSDKTLMDVTRTCNLIYDRHKCIWTLLVPGDVAAKKVDRSEAKTQCGIDPGIRTFLTVYSPNKVYNIGDHQQGVLIKILRKIDQLNKHCTERDYSGKRNKKDKLNKFKAFFYQT